MDGGNVLVLKTKNKSNDVHSTVCTTRPGCMEHTAVHNDVTRGCTRITQVHVPTRGYATDRNTQFQNLNQEQTIVDGEVAFIGPVGGGGCGKTGSFWQRGQTFVLRCQCTAIDPRPAVLSFWFAFQVLPPRLPVLLQHRQPQRQV